ncbi:Ig-like domain-containing protein [Candidatus Roizmanbacteria bacterium]|nr:Ig-like domain-containing protein [Candidatus Roizmanbacteria bacterium]
MDKKLTGLILIFILTFSVFSALLVFREPITQYTRAKEDITPDAAKSTILAWPINDIKATGSDVSNISVFVRSINGRPLENKSVSLSSSIGTVNAISDTTNKNGEAKFTLSSSSPGVAEVLATVQPDIQLTQKVSIEFE